MHYPLLVAILNRTDQPLRSISGHVLLEILLLYDLIKQFSAFHQFHNQAPVTFIFKHINKFNHVWMVERFQDLNLRLCSNFIFITHLLFA